MKITGYVGFDTKLVIPAQIEGLPVTSIGDYAFSNCSPTSIDLPNSITEIQYAVFCCCSSLTSIGCGENLTTIGDRVFSGCSSLSSIYFRGDAPQFDEDVFFRVVATAYYPINNTTWRNDVRQNYGGRITWIAYDLNHIHAYEAVVTAPTCTKWGYTASTCAEKGFESDVCSRCGHTETRNVEATGHSWSGSACASCAADRENPFSNVPEDSFYYEPVLWAVENGIITGATADTFNPNRSCLRAHVVAFLHRAAGNPEPTATNNPFNDVKSSDFFYKSVLWDIENGITNGVDATHFGPTTACSRVQVVMFLYRAYK